MPQQIAVEFQLITNAREIVQIPVRYTIIENTVLCTKTVRCIIDLPPNCVPKWLTPTSFQMVNRYQSGLHVVYYKDNEITNIDAEFFRYKLYADIMLRERLREGKRMEHC